MSAIRFGSKNTEVRIHQLLIFLIVSLSLKGQQGWYLGAGFIDAFNPSEIKVGTRPVHDLQTYGYRAEVIYSYPLKSFDIRFGAGYKQLFFSGNHNLTEFHGNTSKLRLLVGGLYNWSEQLKTGIGFSLENNRDFSGFRTQTTDLYRYNIYGEVNYLIYTDLFLTLNYSKALYPIVDFYTLSNPTDQLCIGIIYKLPWL